ncbi:hypothetical protein ABK046_49755, partial [Streptomyces caeruleatus]
DFFTAAIPADLEVTNLSTNFDPKETTKMFAEGFRLAKEGAFKKAPKADPSATGIPTPPTGGKEKADPKAGDPKEKENPKADDP